jgi:hypothetical protein
VVAVEHPHGILGVFKAAGRAGGQEGNQSAGCLTDSSLEKHQGSVQQLSIGGGRSKHLSHHFSLFKGKINIKGGAYNKILSLRCINII